MPSIDNFSVKPQSKKFKKTAYRPWTIIDGAENQMLNTAVGLNQEEDSTNVLLKKPQIEIKNSSETQNNNTQDHTNSYQPVGNQYGTDYQSNENLKENTKKPVIDQHGTRLSNGYKTISNQISNQNTESLSLEIGPHFRDAWTFEKAVYELSRLVGLQRKILLFIGTNCISKEGLSSGPISVQELRQLLGTDVATIKTATQRLVTKEFVFREVGKRGTGGFSLFLIQNSLKQAILQEIKASHITGGLVTNMEPKKEPKNPTNNSSYFNSITTSSQIHQNWLPTEWQKINFQPLEEIGFTESHLAQIYKFGGLSSEMVEDSIKAYSFDLQINNKAQKIKGGDPINYFMGIMKKGMPYAPPANYEDPQERAYKNYIENKKLQQQRKEELAREAFEFSFNDWVESLTDEQVQQIVPEPSYRSLGSPFRKGALELYFKKNIWGNIIEEIKATD